MKFAMGLHVAAAAATIVKPEDLDTDSRYSVRNVASTIASGAMSYYKGNTSANAIDMGDLQDPYYWWVAGALWGAMLDYYHFTGDPSYNDVVIEALLAPTNTGPEFNYMPEEHAFEEGNDDLFFWGSAVISAAERNFPQPKEDIPSWLELGANVFNQLVGRWNTTACGGGVAWQVYPSNPNGMDYKNSVSNGGFFQLAARMARATGNDTYLDWAQTIWDWSYDIGFIDNEAYHVYDGASSAENCSVINGVSFTYTSGIYLHGAAVLANYTGDATWADRSAKLLDGAGWFFSPADNATDIMYEAACEGADSCNADMTTHKGYLSRFMWQATTLQPALLPTVERLLQASSKAAAASCTGGDDGVTCGVKWYVGGYDGNPGLGQQMCALETIQGLLSGHAAPPLTAADIKVVRDTTWPAYDPYQPDDGSAKAETTKASGTKTGESAPTKRSGANRAEVTLSGLGLSVGAAMALWGLA